MKPTTTSRLLSAFLLHAAGRACTAGGAMLTLLCATWLSAAPASAFGQTLDDFKTAANSEGVNLIPFPDLRRDATAIADEVQRRKDDVKSFDYDLLEKQKNNLLKQVAAKQAEIEEIQQFKKDFESQHPGADLRTFDDDIAKRTSAIAELNGQITTMNETLAKAVDGFERLYQARAGLREYFDKAMSQLSDAKSDPSRYLGSGASEDDKQQLTSYIDASMDKIKAGMSDHRVQENGAQSTKARFETLLKKTE
jgi:chromosome segregation ATPase